MQGELHDQPQGLLQDRPQELMEELLQVCIFDHEPMTSPIDDFVQKENSQRCGRDWL
jgi:hypothetical protein